MKCLVVVRKRYVFFNNGKHQSENQMEQNGSSSGKSRWDKTEILKKKPKNGEGWRVRR